MDEDLAELEKKVEQLIAEDSGNSSSNLDAIVEESGYSRTFVKFVLDTVDLHYNDSKLFRHIVHFVASKLKDLGKEEILTATHISSAYNKSLSSLCAQLKNDSAFSICSFDSKDSESFAGEFPLLTQLAIVATYCASYNPQVTDRRFFFKGKDVLKRKARIGSSSGRSTSTDKWHESGPRMFDHQRAMFIFLYFCKEFDEQLLEEGIWDNSVKSEVDFTSQISNLVEAGLLQVVSSPDNLDLPKYRSLCSLAFVKQIAMSISKELDLEGKYLADFVRDF